MVNQYPEQIRKNDPEIKRLISSHWQYLPVPMKKASANISKIRWALIAFIALFFLMMFQTAMESTPSEYISNLLTLNMLLLIFVILAGVYLAVTRAMNIAPYYIDVMCQLMPDHEDRIRQIYSERGLGDVFAPWIRNKSGIFSKGLNRLAKRFYIKP